MDAADEPGGAHAARGPAPVSADAGPPPWREEERLEALADAAVLDTPPERAFDDIVALVRDICRVPIALVSLVAAERQWFKAKVGVAADQTPLDTSVCALAIRQHGPLVIPDLAVDPRTAHFSLVARPPHLRFYAGVPLVTEGGMPLGSLCAIDTAPRAAGLDATQLAALEALGRLVIALIQMGAAERQRAAAMAASHPLGTWDWDIESDILTADAAFAALHGVDPEVARRGTSIERFFDAVHEGDLPGLRARSAAALATGGRFDAEYRLRQPDGSIRWVAARGECSLGADGRPLRFPGVSFDVTERRGAEQRQAALLELGDRLRDLTDPADIAYTATEILGRTLDVSRAGYGRIDPIAETAFVERDWNAPGIQTLAGTVRYRGYGSYIEDLKRGETVVCPDADHDPRTRDHADALKGIGAHAFVNMPLTEHGGLVALLYVNHARPRAWHEDEIAFMREIAERTRGAAERRRVERELAALTASLERQVEERSRSLLAAEEQLRQAQKMEAVGQLTGGLAHDFNNMLTGISGALEMMQVRVAQGRLGELERYVTAAQGAARRAAALTHRLLAFSRRQTLNPRPTDLNRLARDMEELIRRTIGPGTTLEVVGAAELWTVMVDPNQLESALLNLCINARDAMPDGGRITVETANTWFDGRTGRERDLAPGQYVSLCVTDTGTGMTPETAARAFDPFFTTKPMGEGTGLGLSMIYGFVRQSGGQVRIYSEVGQGTTMCLYLPRHYGDAERAAETPAAAPPPAEASARTVLVVDDEPTIRMLVTEVLEDQGYTAIEAGDGASAVALLRSGMRIDLLITDVGLPGAVNGRQVADAARAARPGLKVIFITGYAENAVIGNQQLEPGMTLVTKPFTMGTLAAQVRALIPPEV